MKHTCEETEGTRKKKERDRKVSHLQGETPRTKPGGASDLKVFGVPYTQKSKSFSEANRRTGRVSEESPACANHLGTGALRLSLSRSRMAVCGISEIL
jgi:hypothetical protein